MSNLSLATEHIITGIENQGYAIIENAFSSAMIKELLVDCISNPLEFKSAAIGRKKDAQLNTLVRKDKTRWFLAKNNAQQEYLAIMEELRIMVNRHLYLGLFDYECHYAKYEQGDFYKKHLDAFKGRSNRIFTTITYLNTPEQGGELLIYSENSADIIVKVAPKAGTLILFESERFPHEVLPAQSLRYSIAGWFRNNNPLKVN